MTQVPASPAREPFLYAAAGPDVIKLIDALEQQIGTATPAQKGNVQFAFNAACLKGIGLPEGPYNYLYEKISGSGGVDTIVKCPRIENTYHVPADCTPLKKWEYERAVENANPTSPRVQNFKL